MCFLFVCWVTANLQFLLAKKKIKACFEFGMCLKPNFVEISMEMILQQTVKFYMLESTHLNLTSFASKKENLGTEHFTLGRFR